MARKKSIASLGVTLVARTSTFKKRMLAAKALTKRFASGMVSGAKSLAKMGTAIVAVGSAIAVALIKKQLTAIDTLAKTAQKFGILNRELSELRFAAELAGVPVKSLDVGLQRFGRRLSEAAAGNQGLRDTFAELGLDAVQLQTMGVAEAFKALAPAFQKQASATDRVRLAFKLFDTEGVDLVNLMTKGSGAFRQAEKDVHQFGLEVSQVAGEQVQAANDSFGLLGKVMTGAFRQSAIEITPYAAAIADHILGVAREGDTMQVRVQRTFKLIVSQVAGAIQKVVGFVDDLNLAFRVISDTIADIGQAPAQILDAFGVGELFGISREGAHAATRERDAETSKFRHEAKQRQKALDPDLISDWMEDIARQSKAEAKTMALLKEGGFQPTTIKSIKSDLTAEFEAISKNRFAEGGEQLGRNKSNPMTTDSPDVVTAIKDLSDVLRVDLRGGVAL